MATIGSTTRASEFAALPAVFPNGSARQLRVQYRTSTANHWSRFGVFSRRSQAVACVDRLRAGGYTARLLEIRVVPVAG